MIADEQMVLAWPEGVVVAGFTPKLKEGVDEVSRPVQAESDAGQLPLWV